MARTTPTAMSSRTNHATRCQMRFEKVTTGRSSFMSLIPSRTAPRFPYSRPRQAFPAEGVLARPVLLQMLQPLDCLLHHRSMSGRHPPHHEIALVHALEPLVAAAVEAFVHRLPDEPLERLDAVPYRQVDRHARIAGERAGVDGASAVVLIAPDKSWAALGQAVHEREVVDEVRHARIADLVAQTANVELREMKRCHQDMLSITPPPPAPAPGAGWRCTRRCAARSRAGSGEAGPVPARPRHPRRRRSCGPRSGW